MAVEIIGLKEANRAMKKLPEYARGEVQEAMNLTAFHVARAATAAAPRDTGLLQGSIQWASRPRSVSAVVGILPQAFYWKYLEYGTVRIQARPFLRSAAERERDPHHQRMLKALEKAANHVESDASGSSRFL